MARHVLTRRLDAGGLGVGFRVAAQVLLGVVWDPDVEIVRRCVCRRGGARGVSDD